MKEPMYHIALDDNEQSAVIQSLKNTKLYKLMTTKPGEGTAA